MVVEREIFPEIAFEKRSYEGIEDSDLRHTLKDFENTLCLIRSWPFRINRLSSEPSVFGRFFDLGTDSIRGIWKEVSSHEIIKPLPEFRLGPSRPYDCYYDADRMRALAAYIHTRKKLYSDLKTEWVDFEKLTKAIQVLLGNDRLKSYIKVIDSVGKRDKLLHFRMPSFTKEDLRKLTETDRDKVAEHVERYKNNLKEVDFARDGIDIAVAQALVFIAYADNRDLRRFDPELPHLPGYALANAGKIVLKYFAAYEKGGLRNLRQLFKAVESTVKRDPYYARAS